MHFPHPPWSRVERVWSIVGQQQFGNLQLLEGDRRFKRKKEIERSVWLRTKLSSSRERRHRSSCMFSQRRVLLPPSSAAVTDSRRRAHPIVVAALRACGAMAVLCARACQQPKATAWPEQREGGEAMPCGFSPCACTYMGRGRGASVRGSWVGLWVAIGRISSNYT
jgi:hypothetical protein